MQNVIIEFLADENIHGISGVFHISKLLKTLEMWTRQGRLDVRPSHHAYVDGCGLPGEEVSVYRSTSKCSYAKSRKVCDSKLL